MVPLPLFYYHYLQNQHFLYINYLICSKKPFYWTGNLRQTHYGNKSVEHRAWFRNAQT